MTTWMLKQLSKVFRLIPGDGKKTMRGLAIIGLGYLFTQFAEYLPVQPTDEDITKIVDNLSIALDAFGQILQLFGIGLTGVGATHKAVKIVEPKGDKPQWEE